MNKLKKALIIGFITIISINGYSQPQNRLFLSIDGLAPAVKFGMERKITERFSLKASAGFCIVGPSLLSYNFFATYKITKPEKALGLNLNFGFLDNYVDVITPVFSLGFGGAAGIYYRFQNNSTLTFRLGMITGPSIDDKELGILTLPNFGIEYAFRFNKNSKENK